MHGGTCIPPLPELRAPLMVHGRGLRAPFNSLGSLRIPKLNWTPHSTGDPYPDANPTLGMPFLALTKA